LFIEKTLKWIGLECSIAIKDQERENEREIKEKFTNIKI